MADFRDRFGAHVDDNTFQQILEMDEDEEEREFSKPLVLGFCAQAEDTFKEMDAALDVKNLEKLSNLGHFLKGSSATLGFNKLRDSCQVIQQYGHKQRSDGTPEPDEAVCLKKISDAIIQLKSDFQHLENLLYQFFNIEQ